MYRYISLVWNAADPQVAETAKFLKAYFKGREISWRTAYEGNGLLVLHTAEEKNHQQAYPLRAEEDHCGGVVLGKLLKRERNPEVIARNADLNISESRKIIHTAGRHLVDEYWGSYVAFFQDGLRKYILVDPIGVFSCFSTLYRGVEIYFTYLPDVAACRFLNFSVDWAIIAKSLKYYPDKTDAPLNEVAKILPGQCLTVSPNKTTKTFYWNPQKISQTNVIEDMEEAAQTLRQTILSTVAALAEPYDSVIHQIGGLDSSILLAALSEVPTPLDVTCFNLFHRTPGGDERYFVRQATQHVDAPLIEYGAGALELNFNEMSKVPVTTSPADYFGEPGFKKFLYDKVHETNAQAVFNGKGGDEILYTYGLNYPAIDFIKAHGIRPPLFRVIMEVAKIQNRSIWSVLPKIIRGGFGKNQFPETPETPTSLLTSDIQDMIPMDEILHPWLQVKDNVTPGKLDHISPLAYGQYNEEYRTAPDQHFHTIYPYLSQPVIEACLRIPLWLMLAHGKNRGLARKAFKNHLPAEVIWRESKQAGDNYYRSIILDNYDTVKALMLEGEMVKDHVLDRGNLEKALMKGHDIERSDFDDMIFYLNMEIWARKMKGEKLTDMAPSGVERPRQMI